MRRRDPAQRVGQRPADMAHAARSAQRSVVDCQDYRSRRPGLRPDALEHVVVGVVIHLRAEDPATRHRNHKRRRQQANIGRGTLETLPVHILASADGPNSVRAPERSAIVLSISASGSRNVTAGGRRDGSQPGRISLREDQDGPTGSAKTDSRYSHALAVLQSRITVISELLRNSAVSATLSPPKKRSSIWCRNRQKRA